MISKFNKRFRCVIDIYSKYPWAIPLKDKKGIKITNAFQKILGTSNSKTNKIWVDKGSEFCTRSMKSWLEKNAMEMNSTNNEERSVVTERFIRTFKNKMCKYMTLVSKNVSIDKLDDKLVNKYDNTYHITIKIKPADVKANTLHKKMKFFIKDFSCECDQIRRKLKIWSHLMKKSLMENFIFCAVTHMLTLVKILMTKILNLK